LVIRTRSGSSPADGRFGRRRPRRTLLVALTGLIAILVVGCGTAVPTETTIPSTTTASPSPILQTPAPTPPPSPTASPTPDTTPQAPPPTATPRPSYKPYPLVTIPIQAIQVTDDDGTRPADITPEQVAWWVDRANEIYANAFIRFAFDPGKDFATVRSTVVNDMVNPQDHPDMGFAVRFANDIAARYPGKLTVLFRHGVGYVGTGLAFSSTSHNFVAMTGFQGAPCGQDGGFLAHEIGHYFGLTHTFATAFGNQQEAADALRAARGDLGIFDGDGLSDTPPDPFIREYQCGTQGSVTLGPTTLLLPRSNVMSYYANATDLSPQQIELIRPVLDFRVANGMALPTNANLQAPIEAESLTFESTPPGVCGAQDMTPYGQGRWSGDQQLTCWFAQKDATVSIRLPPVQTSGRYELVAYLTRGQGYGTVQASFDDKPVGKPFNADAVVPVTPAAPLSLGTVVLSRGEHELRFTAIEPNPIAGTYIFGIDAVTLTP